MASLTGELLVHWLYTKLNVIFILLYVPFRASSKALYRTTDSETDKIHRGIIRLGSQDFLFWLLHN